MPRFLFIGPWVVAALGVAMIVLAVVFAIDLGDWLDTNSATGFPSILPLFAIGGLGLIVAAAGCAIGVSAIVVHGDDSDDLL